MDLPHAMLRSHLRRNRNLSRQNGSMRNSNTCALPAFSNHQAARVWDLRILS